eukprot:4948284-Pyramimonas_sp.AAC.1
MHNGRTATDTSTTQRTGCLVLCSEQSRAAVPTVDDRAAWGPSRRSWSGSGPSPSEWPLSWCSCPRCAPR